VEFDEAKLNIEKLLNSFFRRFGS